MNRKEERIAKLNATQQRRKQDCIDRTEKAIFKLLNNHQRLSFSNIAREANVSVSYLYKYPEVKERIQEIRKSQVKQARILTRPQTASEKSKQVIIQQLRERINLLEFEKKELKKQNEKMTGELYQIGIKLDLFDRVKQETVRQTEQIKQLQIELEISRDELTVCQTKLMESHPEFTSIHPQINNSVQETEIDEELNVKISILGIKVNATMNKIIESKTHTEISNALLAVEEYLNSEKKIKSKSGLFRKALEEGWTPNFTHEERQINQVTDSFSDWFKLAKEQGLVKASQGTKKGIIVLEANGEWTPLERILEKGWTLEYLQQRSNR